MCIFLRITPIFQERLEFFGKNGGNDETRTRDLWHDSGLFFGNCLKLRGTDGRQSRAEETPRNDYRTIRP